jgi:hypothetical protein
VSIDAQERPARPAQHNSAVDSIQSTKSLRDSPLRGKGGSETGGAGNQSLLENPRRAEFNRAWQGFHNGMQPGDQIAVFFAG